MGKLQVKALKSDYGKKKLMPIFMRRINNFFYNIAQTIKWLPTICQDRQWDDAYIFDILAKKLSLMYDFYNSDKPATADAQNTANEILEVLTILKRIQKNDYIDMTEFNEKFPDYDWDAYWEDDEEGNLKMNRYDTEEQGALLGKIYKNSDLAEQKDLDDLFILLRKNIQNWWD